MMRACVVGDGADLRAWRQRRAIRGNAGAERMRNIEPRIGRGSGALFGRIGYLSGRTGGRTSPACARPVRSATARSRSSGTCDRAQQRRTRGLRWDSGVKQAGAMPQVGGRGGMLFAATGGAPLPALVVPLVLEADCDLVVRERPHWADRPRTNVHHF